jgi:RNA polymerase sigma factor (sigma-70 family)
VQRVAELKEASNEDVLAACLRGEAAGWEVLLDRYAALIYSIPFKYGLSPADAADVFQSVCVTLFEKLDTIRAPRGLAAWIMTTTSRQCLVVARRRRREQALSVGEVWLTPAPGVPDPDLLPEDELLSLERQQIVRLAVDRLSPRCRKLIQAMFSDAAEQQTYHQLANGLGVPMNSLGPTRARCLEHLRRLLLAAGYVP